MNWTGGRLRRQSHIRSNHTLKIQKQHFARARLKQRESSNKARNSSVTGPSFACCSEDTTEPSQLVNEPQRTQSTQHNDCANRLFELVKPSQDPGGNLTPRNEILKAHANSLEIQGNPRVSYLDFLKQYLLGQKDWVGISPTRPLRMKFTPIEEKEQIGKRRKLSQDEEAKSAALAKSISNISRISTHDFNAQLSHKNNDALGWGMEIQISTPKKMGRVAERSESSVRRSRSASSDYMLLGTQEDEGDNGFSVEAILPETTELNLQPTLSLDNFASSAHISKDLNFAALPGTHRELRSSPAPVLHRFTLDDQVHAERIANSQSSRSSAVHRPDCRDFYQDMSQRHDVPDLHRGAIPSFSSKSTTDDRCIDITGCHESDPTESDVLPQTQKISRILPPSQPPLDDDIRSETSFQSLESLRDISMIEDRPMNDPVSTDVENNKSSIMFFGQEVQYIPPLQPNTEIPFRFARPNIRQNAFASNIHGYRHKSPHTQSSNAPKIESWTKGPKTASNKFCPSSTFRFPGHWTPHRNIQRLEISTDCKDRDNAFSISAFTTSLPQRSTVPITLTKNAGHGRHNAGGMLNRLDKLYENVSDFVDYEETRAPVFNTPYRR